MKTKSNSIPFKKLGEVVEISTGSTPHTKNQSFWNGHHVWLTISDLNKRIVLNSKNKITDLAASEMRLVPAGSLLMSFKLSIGKLAFAGSDLFTNEAICFFSNYKGLDKDYLFYALQVTDFSLEGKQAVKGCTLNQQSLKNIKIPFPDLAEQRRIAAILTDLDDLIEAQEALISKKKAINEATMELLLTGKKRLPGFSKSWTKVRIKDVAIIDPEIIRYDQLPSFSFKYITIESVKDRTANNCQELKFSEAPGRARKIVQPFDVLFSNVRPNLKSHLLFLEKGSWVASTGFTVIRCKKNNDPQFLFEQIFSKNIDSQVDTLTVGSNYPALNSTQVGNLKISIPEFAEQVKIGEIQKTIHDEIQLLKYELVKMKDEKNAVMHKLFSGESISPPETDLPSEK